MNKCVSHFQKYGFVYTIHMHAHILSIDDNLSKISPSRGPHLSPFISLPSIYSYIQPLSTTYQVSSANILYEEYQTLPLSREQVKWNRGCEQDYGII